MERQIWAITTLTLKVMRKNNKRSNSSISFVVDGKCEFWYLQKWREYENLNINLKPKLPKTKTLKKQFDLAVELSLDSEKVFWIIDFDTILKETREAKKGIKTPPLREFQELYNKCKRYKNIIVIVNNPCLEYWFLQHFERTAKHFLSCEQVEKPLKKYLPDYKKTEKYYKNSRLNIYQRLQSNLPNAITNAEKLGEFDFNKVQSEGIAEMHKIFNELTPTK